MSLSDCLSKLRCKAHDVVFLNFELFIEIINVFREIIHKFLCLLGALLMEVTLLHCFAEISL